MATLGMMLKSNALLRIGPARGGLELANTQSFINGLCRLIGVELLRGSRPERLCL